MRTASVCCVGPLPASGNLLTFVVLGGCCCSAMIRLLSRLVTNRLGGTFCAGNPDGLAVQMSQSDTDKPEPDIRRIIMRRPLILAGIVWVFLGRCPSDA